MAIRHMVVRHNIIAVCVHVDPEMCQCPEGGRNKGRASSKVPMERKTGCMECALGSHVLWERKLHFQSSSLKFKCRKTKENDFLP